MTAAAGEFAEARLPWPVTLYLFCVVIPIGFNVGPLFLTTLRLMAILVTAPLFLRLLTGHYGKVFATDILLLIHVLWMAVALAVNNPDQMIEQVGSTGAEFLGGYVIGRAYIRTPEAFYALARRLVVIILCLFPFALAETMTGRPYIIEYLRKLPGVISLHSVTTEGRLGLERVQAVFPSPIHFGLFCSITFSLAMVGLKGHSSNAWRYLTSAVIALSGFLALSSGALLAMILQLGLITWSVMFASVKQRWWILVGLFVLAYIVVDLLSNRTPIRVFMSYATFSAHTAYYRAVIFEWGLANVIGSAAKGIPASPIFGIGMNEWIRPSYMYDGSMDNFWLLAAVQFGLPGFAAIALGYILGIAQVMRRNFDADPHILLFRRAWVFTLVGLSFTLCTVDVWTNIYSFVFFILGAGMWLITYQPRLGATGAEPDPHAPSERERRQPRYTRFPPSETSGTA